MKRAARARTTRDSTTHDGDNTARTSEAQPAHAVICTKADGRRIVFQEYRTLIEAELVARHLRAVGCAATVE
jgi:hypothetical protein